MLSSRAFGQLSQLLHLLVDLLVSEVRPGRKTLVLPLTVLPVLEFQILHARTVERVPRLTLPHRVAPLLASVPQHRGGRRLRGEGALQAGTLDPRPGEDLGTSAEGAAEHVGLGGLVCGISEPAVEVARLAVESLAQVAVLTGQLADVVEALGRKWLVI